MAKINMKQVVLGGLLAGLVLNAGEFVLNELLLGDRWAEVMQGFDQPAFGGGAIGIFVALGFVLAWIAVWVYAAIRPRMGPGPATAVCAGVVVWALAYLYPSLGLMVTGLFPSDLILIGIVWSLFEVPLATLVGAWVYKED